MKKKLLSIVLSIVGAALVILTTEFIFQIVHPFPENMDYSSVTQMESYIETMPLYAFVLVLVGWSAASFLAGYILRYVLGRQDNGMVVLIGTILTIISAYNLTQFHHPLWFSIAAILIWLPFVWLGHITPLADKKP